MQSSTLQPGESIKPVVSQTLAAQLIKQHFGHEITKIKELNSYDDKNFYVESNKNRDDGGSGRFIFKVLNSMDSQKTGHIEAEHKMMFYLSSKGIKCPIPQENVQGNTFSLVELPSKEDSENANLRVHLIRLLSFVEGKILYDVPISAKLLTRTGAFIANLENLLKVPECKHEALENFSSVWKLGHVLDLEKFIFVIKDQPQRFNLVSSILNAYKTKVVPVLDQLETGVVHGDYNEQNVLVEPSEDDYEMGGIIDFGDAHVGPYVFELAITVCYMMLESVRCQIVDPFQSVAYVIKGYSTHRKISQLDLDIMRTLVACRLSQSLVIGAYSHSQDPGNEYLLTTASRGWKLLEQIWNEKTDKQFSHICTQLLNN